MSDTSKPAEPSQLDGLLEQLHALMAAGAVKAEFYEGGALKSVELSGAPLIVDKDGEPPGDDVEPPKRGSREWAAGILAGRGERT